MAGNTIRRIGVHLVDNAFYYATPVLLATLAFSFYDINKYQHDLMKLKETAIIKNERDDFHKLYGFDENKDGQIDRIEVRGYEKNADLASTRFEKTYLRGDRNFEEELHKLNENAR